MLCCVHNLQKKRGEKNMRTHLVIGTHVFPGMPVALEQESFCVKHRIDPSTRRLLLRSQGESSDDIA